MNARGVDGPLAQARRWVEADGVHIDVRGLQPPGPLVALLELVESIRDATPVIVHHERDPQLLYPELADTVKRSFGPSTPRTLPGSRH